MKEAAGPSQRGLSRAQGCVGPGSSGWEGGSQPSALPGKWAVEGRTEGQDGRGRGLCLLLCTRKQEPAVGEEGAVRRQWWGRSPRRWGEGSPPGRDRGTGPGRDSLPDVLSRMKVVCAHSRKWGTHRTGRGERAGRELPLSSRPREMGSDQKTEPSESPAPAVWPEPPTKGHSQSGLIRDRRRAARPGHRLSRGRRTIGPLWEAGRALQPPIPRQEHASLPYSRRQIGGDNEMLP